MAPADCCSQRGAPQECFLLKSEPPPVLKGKQGLSWGRWPRARGSCTPHMLSGVAGRGKMWLCQWRSTGTTQSGSVLGGIGAPQNLRSCFGQRGRQWAAPGEQGYGAWSPAKPSLLALRSSGPSLPPGDISPGDTRGLWPGSLWPRPQDAGL